MSDELTVARGQRFVKRCLRVYYAFRPRVLRLPFKHLYDVKILFSFYFDAALMLYLASVDKQSRCSDGLFSPV